MKLSVKEFSDLVALTVEARVEAWHSVESSRQDPKHRPIGEPVGKTHCNDPGCGVCCVPTPDVSSARFVIDTTEVQRVVAEAVDAERQTIATMLENSVCAFPEAQRESVMRAVEMVRARAGRR